jgi:hypothetical protein
MQPLRAVKRRAVRQFRSPFASSRRPLIVHCSHHKAGTVWLFGVLRSIALHHGLQVVEFDSVAPVAASTDIALFAHTRDFRRSSAGSREIRGSHMVRDPRDLVVSAYYYHLRTGEQWVHAPRPEYDGRSYQEHLRSLDKHDGLRLEMNRLESTVFRDMAQWDYTQRDFCELRYEDLLANEQETFLGLFGSYGFSPSAAARATDLALQLGREARSRSGGDSHIRSGQPGEWREHFTADDVERIKEIAGDIIVSLGYESTPHWT